MKRRKKKNGSGSNPFLTAAGKCQIHSMASLVAVFFLFFVFFKQFYSKTNNDVYKVSKEKSINKLVLMACSAKKQFTPYYIKMTDDVMLFSVHVSKWGRHVE